MRFSSGRASRKRGRRRSVRRRLALTGLLAAAVSGLWSARGFLPSPFGPAYDRALYEHWVDADGDCRDTRHELLARTSLEPVTWSADGCRVRRGRWFDPYTGKVFTDPGDLDVDHVIPLAEVHRSGGARWSAERRRAYANDLRHKDTLLAVAAGANRSKGDRDPVNWLPPRWRYRCAYLARWVGVKKLWQLRADPLEWAMTRTGLFLCHLL